MVAFDDLPAGLAVEPFMTVIEQPAYEMGSRAAELLFARLSGRAPAECQEVILPIRMIVRDSSDVPSEISRPQRA